MFTAHRVTNISRGGLFIEGNSLPLNSELILRLHLVQDGVVIEVRARVVWNYDIQKGTTHLVRGVGLRFLDIGGDSLRKLKAYLTKLATSHGQALPTSPA